MNDSVRDLINGIRNDDSLAVSDAFDFNMADKVATGISGLKVDVAASMFISDVDESESSSKYV